VTDKILEVRGLTKTYGGEKKPGAKQPTPTLDVLKGIDIDIYRGDVVCLIGPSGCGKSTFLRCLNRLEIPTSGSVKFEGTEVDEAHIDAVRQKMGMVFQHFNLFPHLTVKKNLELAPTLLKLKDKEAISAKADELLARVGLADKANVYPKSLSGRDPVRRAHQRPRPRNGGRGSGTDEGAGPHRHHHAGGHPRNGLRPRGVQPRHLHRRRQDSGGRAAAGTVHESEASQTESIPFQDAVRLFPHRKRSAVQNTAERFVVLRQKLWYNANKALIAKLVVMLSIPYRCFFSHRTKQRFREETFLGKYPARSLEGEGRDIG